MPSTLRPLVIDAQPRGPRGLLAADLVRGRTVLDHTLKLASTLTTPEQIAIHVPIEEHEALANLVDERLRTRIQFVSHLEPNEARMTLRTDRLYASSKLRTAWKKGRDPESAVIWRLDTENGRRGADDEFERRSTYQPLGRYWAIGPARFLARTLAPTPIRPNMVTLASAGLMLTATAVVAFGPFDSAMNSLVATLLALGLILDTTDGHLARLQGTTSKFGRWLDSWLDEVCDMTLHMAIAWSAYRSSGHVGWLVVGMLYGMGKSIFMVGVNEWREDSNGKVGNDDFQGRFAMTQWIRWMGHADLRWHLWIALALVGQLPVALAVYAFYFPARAILGAARKGARYA